MVDLGAILADLDAESAELDALVAPLPGKGWRSETPSPGWSIAHQIAHLAWTDLQALLAATDQVAFAAVAELARSTPTTFVDEGAAAGATQEPGALLAQWRTGRGQLAQALAALPPGARVPWYGPPMSAASMASARLMETWAHGQDVADALQICRTPTDRLRHVSRIGVRARDYAYLVRGLNAPATEFRVELQTPDGSGVWSYGPSDAPERVTGSALDFCLLVTQRRHRDDLDLKAVGAEADRWLDIAQAFAGLPGNGRTPGQFG